MAEKASLMLTRSPGDITSLLKKLISKGQNDPLKKPLQIQRSSHVVKMTFCKNRQMSLVIMTIKKLALMAILTAIALIIFIIEAQIPMPIPVPGVKLGLQMR